MSTSKRKLDHIRICLERKVEAECHPFEDIQLIHRALPETDFSEIETGCTFLGTTIQAPIMISAMTGGHRDALEINRNLALAAQELGLPMGVGSQRAALENPALEDTFSVVREAAPDVPLIGNIGAVQIRRLGPQVVEQVAEMIDADAVAVHLNFLQEAVQPEGETDGTGVLEAIKSASSSKIPIMVKETGAGIGREDAATLFSAGVRTIDVAGLGGTSWSGVEAYRAEERGDDESRLMGQLFFSWGLPTPVCIVECQANGAQIISSGGIRSGIDVARSLALGASLAGTALPMLQPASQDWQSVVKMLKAYIRALKISMFLTGNRTISDLRGSPVLILGQCREILEQRGINTKNFTLKRELSR
ncbi:MAG: type 2 isopentenyl-diphosphate Delta-isomerase [Methanosarcinales archaeon]|nr:type 2 isopentenyl-diphosphate Delta-isomerase [Methanosarcinales archaeon]